jgi:two-component system cell cycle response regulator
MKVLIVDDSPDALAVAKARLAGEGIEVLCAHDGHSGLASARSEKPDAILLDLDMPDLSGFEVCRALKSDPDLNAIPVVFLSGSGSPENKVMGLNLGAVDYVTKPFDAFELKARVRAVLRTKHLQDLLIEQARIDPLTELPNRRAFCERLEQEWTRAERYGKALSLIMADIDHFKSLNDAYGHQVGDEALQEVARKIKESCRAVDLPARYGGEEFVIIVPDTPADGAGRLAERCRRAIEGISIQIGRSAIGLTASFGIADTACAHSAESMIRKADEAMYRAKAAGRNRVEGVPGPIELAEGGPPQ